MANPRALTGFYSVILLVAAFLCFTYVNAEESSKSKDHEKDAFLSDDSSQDDSKGKIEY